jgi:microcystin-dependent protein
MSAAPYGYGFPPGFQPVALPVGAVLPYAGPINACTRRLLAQRGWLFCDGSLVTVAQYPELHAVIRTLYGTPGSPAGAFLLPDYRGVFLRGVGFAATRCDGSPRDPDASQRQSASCTNGGNTGDAVGSVEADAFQGHQHDYLEVAQAGVPNDKGTALASPATSQPTSAIVASTAPDYGTPRVAKETRPLNVYVHFIIKACSHVPPQRDHGWCPDTRDDPKTAPLT